MSRCWELALTGEGGFLPEMVKAALERGLATELTGHLGYEKGDPAGRGSPNSRNGSSPKTLATEIGPVPGQQLRTPGWSPRAPGRWPGAARGFRPLAAGDQDLPGRPRRDLAGGRRHLGRVRPGWRPPPGGRYRRPRHP